MNQAKTTYRIRCPYCQEVFEFTVWEDDLFQVVRCDTCDRSFDYELEDLEVFDG